MKVNEEELSIIPSTPRYAKDHMEIYRHAKGFLDDFLHMDEDIDKLSFQAHNSWIQSYKLEKSDNPTFMIKYGKRVVGLIFLREAYFMGGVQVIYVMNKNFSGRGIMQRALEHILEVAFFSYKYLFVELHIDIDNIPSQRVAEKLGFEVIEPYESLKDGTKSTGHIEIWAKTNNRGPAFWRQIPKEDWMKNNDWVVGQRHASFRKKNSKEKLTKSERINKSN